MAQVTMKALSDGVHFGHRTKVEPKMAAILPSLCGIHIIDLQQRTVHPRHT